MRPRCGRAEVGPLRFRRQPKSDAEGKTDRLGAHPGLRHGVGRPGGGARAEYLAAENRILKTQLKGRLKLSDAERATLAEIGHHLGRKKFSPKWRLWPGQDTILAWYRKLIARKFDGSKARSEPGPAPD